MPELVIKYKNPRVKAALTDFSKYLDFTIQAAPSKKSPAKKNVKLITQIEKGLTDVVKIKQGKLKGLSIKEMLDEK